MKNGTEFLSIPDQIIFLKSVGLKIPNESSAKELLSKHSYYNVFNGYREPFLSSKQPQLYILGVTFNEVFSLYVFDNLLRKIFFRYLLDIENEFKTRCIYCFSSAQNLDATLKHPQDSYLKVSSYEVGHNPLKGNSTKYIATLKLVSELQRIIFESFEHSDCIQHYLLKYDYVPLWVLSTNLTFGQISKFYENMDISEQKNIAIQYSIKNSSLVSILKILTSARNKSGHNSRLYCFSSHLQVPVPDSVAFPAIASCYSAKLFSNAKLFDVMICMKYLLSPSANRKFINEVKTITNGLEKKLKPLHMSKILQIMGFPNNWQALLSA